MVAWQGAKPVQGTLYHLRNSHLLSGFTSGEQVGCGSWLEEGSERYFGLLAPMNNW